MNRKSLHVAAMCALIAIAPGVANAGGFALLEQSAEGVGFGFAGATAGYGDGSAIFFNPGAMGLTKKTLITTGGSLIAPNAKFSNQGSHLNPKLGDIPISGDNGPNGGVNAWLPNFYAIQPLTDDLNVGFAVNSPFGLSTRYSSTWVGRYNAVKTNLTTLTLSPAVSYNITEDLSVGAAVNVMYIGANLTNEVDYGTIGYSVLGPQMASALGMVPGHTDGLARVKGDTWGVGATAGVSYKYCDDSRIGIAYRSPIANTIRGDADFDVPEQAKILTSTGSFVNTDVKADLTTPDSISAGIYHKLSDEWALLADAQWTDWTHFDELRIKYSSAQQDTVVEEGWDNVWRFSGGAEYKPIEDLTLRAGFTYDEDPISDAQHRTPRIPSQDRYWLSVGASYNFTPAFRADVGYAHLFVPSAHSDVTSGTGDVLVGEWDLSIDIVSTQLVWTF